MHTCASGSCHTLFSTTPMTVRWRCEIYGFLCQLPLADAWWPCLLFSQSRCNSCQVAICYMFLLGRLHTRNCTNADQVVGHWFVLMEKCYKVFTSRSGTLSVSLFYAFLLRLRFFVIQSQFAIVKIWKISFRVQKSTLVQKITTFSNFTEESRQRKLWNY